VDDGRIAHLRWRDWGELLERIRGAGFPEKRFCQRIRSWGVLSGADRANEKGTRLLFALCRSGLAAL